MLATQSKFNYEGIGSRIQKAGYQEEVVKKEIVSNYNSTSTYSIIKILWIIPSPLENTMSAKNQKRILSLWIDNLSLGPTIPHNFSITEICPFTATKKAT